MKTIQIPQNTYSLLLTQGGVYGHYGFGDSIGKAKMNLITAGGDGRKPSKLYLAHPETKVDSFNLTHPPEHPPIYLGEIR
jgi:hypothetical protein